MCSRKTWQVRPTLHTQQPVVFSSDFDSGNAGNVKFIGPWRFEISTLPDNAGTPYVTHNRTWWYFSVMNVPKDRTLELKVNNMNNQKAMFKHGMKPVFRTESSKQWHRVIGPVAFNAPNKQECSITFAHTFTNEPNEAVFFAFCYPYSYEECQHDLTELERKYTFESSKRIDNKVPESNEADVREEEEKKRKQKKKKTKKKQQDTIYLYRECLTYSLQGRRVDLLTITNYNSSQAKTHDVDELQNLVERHPFIFPCRKDKKEKCLHFPGKPIVFVSSRVHPGETPASFSFKGFLDFILNEDDPRSTRLRDMFVFKMVPMLNPDGVALGHYRSNTLGLNLNRFYNCPDPKKHPSIAAVKTLLSCYQSSLYLYLDMHAHASKRGCFLYGNHFTDLETQVENVLYSRYVSLNSPYLDIGGCDFSQKNMKTKDKKDQSVSKEGSGRVGIYRSTGIVRCYTLECNYNCGKTITNTYPMNNEKGPLSPAREFNALASDYKYTPETWADVGKACAIAILDTCGTGCNPMPRIEKSPYKSYNGLKLHVQSTIRSSRLKASVKAERKKKKKATTTCSFNGKIILPIV